MTAAAPLHVYFAGGPRGRWRVDRVETVTGASLPRVERVSVTEGRRPLPEAYVWLLHGVTSHERYVRPGERKALLERQPALGRSEATCAALIPIRKSAAWWELPQDERRAIFEDRSHHIATGIRYLPAVARRLHHSRELGEPFDFLTWFEYAPASANRFDELVATLRDTEEWDYVEGELDIRLVLDVEAGLELRP